MILGRQLAVQGRGKANGIALKLYLTQKVILFSFYEVLSTKLIFKIVQVYFIGD